MGRHIFQANLNEFTPCFDGVDTHRELDGLQSLDDPLAIILAEFPRSVRIAQHQSSFLHT
jgi:hypothetical protein